AIAMTALVSDADREQALTAGFQRHLAKPLDIDRLMTAVAETWANAAPRGQQGGNARSIE
ncbi:hypothetical protein, partial [Hyalangium sp.]|uniref:hypothetical protein n=1 Tax=Hyalangium sp. TaxID=2028555 RepID=UPI002D2295A6